MTNAKSHAVSLVANLIANLIMDVNAKMCATADPARKKSARLSVTL
jgi:hypothetical protein